jgi:hypothetical protein
MVDLCQHLVRRQQGANGYDREARDPLICTHGGPPTITRVASPSCAMLSHLRNALFEADQNSDRSRSLEQKGRAYLFMPWT